MGVSREDVLRVAALARLELAEAETDRLVGELDEILGHVEALSDIDHRSSSIEHRSSSIDHRGAAAGSLRDDEPGGDRLSGGAGDFAPAFRGGFFVVPRLASHEDGGAGA